ncbi:hypothetical protein RUND412_003708 [Rhizina undulata]
MTTGAPDGMRIINMEAFEGFTTSVHCSTAGNAKIGLTFKDKQSLKYAINKWGWLNEKEEHKFVMATNHDGCGANAESVAAYNKANHSVNRLDYHEQNFNADLFATETAWEKVASNYTVQFGHIEDGPAIPGNSFATTGNSSAILTTPSTTSSTPIEKLNSNYDEPSKYDELTYHDKKKITDAKKKITGVKENLVENDDAEKKIEGAKKTLGDKFKDTERALDDAGDGTKDSSVNLNLATGTPAKRKSILPILTTSGSSQKVDCIDCYITVRKLRSHGRTHRPSPRRFQRHDEIQRQAHLKHRVPMNFDITLYAVPLGALEVPQIFSFGPKFDFEVGIQATVTKDVDFDFGFKASLPNKSKFHKDLLTKDSAEASGWDKSELDTLSFKLNSGKIDLHLQDSTNAVLGFGIEAIGLTGYEAAPRLKLPRVASQFTIEKDEEQASFVIRMDDKASDEFNHITDQSSK